MYCQIHRRSFCDEPCQRYDVIYKTRCPNLFHIEHHQSIGYLLGYTVIFNKLVKCLVNQSNSFDIFTADSK